MKLPYEKPFEKPGEHTSCSTKHTKLAKEGTFTSKTVLCFAVSQSGMVTSLVFLQQNSVSTNLYVN